MIDSLYEKIEKIYEIQDSYIEKCRFINESLKVDRVSDLIIRASGYSFIKKYKVLKSEINKTYFSYLNLMYDFIEESLFYLEIYINASEDWENVKGRIKSSIRSYKKWLSDNGSLIGNLIPDLSSRNNNLEKELEESVFAPLGFSCKKFENGYFHIDSNSLSYWWENQIRLTNNKLLSLNIIYGVLVNIITYDMHIKYDSFDEFDLAKIKILKSDKIELLKDYIKLLISENNKYDDFINPIYDLFNWKEYILDRSDWNKHLQFKYSLINNTKEKKAHLREKIQQLDNLCFKMMKNLNEETYNLYQTQLKHIYEQYCREFSYDADDFLFGTKYLPLICSTILPHNQRNEEIAFHPDFKPTRYVPKILNIYGNKSLLNIFKKFKKICFFDTETTGLDPNKDHIIELGYVVYEYINGEIMQTRKKDILAKLPNGERLSIDISLLTHIYERDLVSSREELLNEIRNMIKLENTIFFAYNASFDLSFIRKELNFPSLNINCHDLYWFFQRQSFWTDDIGRWLAFENKKLVTVAKMLEINYNNAHRAINDAEVLFEILKKIEECGMLYEMGIY